jgi:hypothetical protein
MMNRILSLPQEDRTRLVKLLGLLSSDHNGEALNAGSMADRLVHKFRLSWSDVIADQSAPPAPELPAQEWMRTAREVLQSGIASPWECGFCQSLLAKRSGWSLTEKQSIKLADVWMRRCAQGRSAA